MLLVVPGVLPPTSDSYAAPPRLRLLQSEPLTKFHEGHLVESETYIGGHVECLEVSSGMTRRAVALLVVT